MTLKPLEKAILCVPFKWSHSLPWPFQQGQIPWTRCHRKHSFYLGLLLSWDPGLALSFSFLRSCFRSVCAGISLLLSRVQSCQVVSEMESAHCSAPRDAGNLPPVTFTAWFRACFWWHLAGSHGAVTLSLQGASPLPKWVEEKVGELENSGRK